MRFERNLIFIKTDFRDKTAVVEFLGGQLVQAGAVQPAYVQAMHQREQDVGTYITEGVAIPHGTEGSRSLVNRAAIVALKIPRGIEWSDGKPVFLAFGIAGNEEDHVSLLSELAIMLMDADQKAKLLAAENEDDLFACLNQTGGND
ncbi:PTS sugar transporter subunit IIA [Acetonema longum]|uniref:Mannitol-specific phosphotransferase enzyme IIA component n=1 Tax=Acetonema longum DSM 6540 TaxID=1009370 RepID=F7NGX7_9FIRM|nr:PTS sugar transporter subunit IIA [Acetonema longum]EGO64708.1 phosphoenolpyruvate-dependent sugar phosphotransferase system EIIA 2 [Acetonema longum DSM 6540]